MSLRVVLSEMDFLHLHMQGAINQALPKSDTQRRLKEYISNQHTSAKEKARLSPNPFEFLLEFKKECIAYSKKYKLGAFSEKP